MNPLILIVEDDPEIAEILSAYLQHGGMRVEHAPDGRRALEKHLMLKPDLMLLDVQLPGIDGWQVLSQVRSRGRTPVIMVTAMDQDIDKLIGLRMGADDYVVKPFNPAEVLARVAAVLRRTVSAGASEDGGQLLRVGPIEIDIECHVATTETSTGRAQLELTPTEFKLLHQMMTAPSRVFTRDRLLATCLPEGESLERTVDSHISKLRRKLEERGVHGVPVAVRGIGYKFGFES